MAEMQLVASSKAALIPLLCMQVLRTAHPSMQVDHKWELDGAEERAAEVLRASLRKQSGKSRHKAPALATKFQ